MVLPALKVFAGPFAATAPTLYAAAASGVAPIGTWFFADENGNFAVPSTKAPFKIGQVIGVTGPVSIAGTPLYVAQIKWSAVINPSMVKNAADIDAYATGAWTPTAPANVGYAAPTEQLTTITFGTPTATVTADTRYVLRIQYTDLQVDGTQPVIFTRSYEYIPDPTDTYAIVATALYNAVNADPETRVVAANPSAGVITLTGQQKIDDGISLYSQVAFNVSVYQTDLVSTVLYNNYYDAVPGLTIGAAGDTAANPGKGFWQKVRDLERYALGYTGDIYATDWIKRNTGYVNSDATKTYAEYSIDFANPYQANDHQYIKDNLQQVILYDSATPAGNSAIISALQAALGL